MDEQDTVLAHQRDQVGVRHVVAAGVIAGRGAAIECGVGQLEEPPHAVDRNGRPGQGIGDQVAIVVVRFAAPEPAYVSAIDTRIPPVTAFGVPSTRWTQPTLVIG